MQIDPKIAFYFGVWTSVLVLVGGSPDLLHNVLPDPWIVHVVAACLLFGKVNNLLLTAAIGFSSMKPGPLAKLTLPSNPLVKLVLGFLIIAIGLDFALPARAEAMGAVPDHQAFRAAAHTGRHTKVAASAPPAAPTAAPAAPAAGSALTTTQVQQNPLLLLQAFSVDDLQDAIKLANAQNPPDTTAANCYTTILNVVQNVANPSAPSGVVGAFTGLQIARDAKATALNLLSPTGPLIGISNACAPLILDAQNTLIGLGVVAGVVANPVGGSVAAAGLPAALAAFMAALPKL